MDHTPFWNIVPSVALFLLVLGMTACVVVDFARARAAAAAQSAAAHGTTPTQEEVLAA
jgi:hypothetical protein